MSKLREYEILEFPKIYDERGNLSFLQNLDQIPFILKRVFWIYDVPAGEIRGSHAYKNQQEIIIALSGSFDVVVDNSVEEKRFNLNRSHYGLHIKPGIWRRMENFSTNASALVLSDSGFKEEDYIRDYKEFLKWKER